MASGDRNSRGMSVEIVTRLAQSGWKMQCRTHPSIPHENLPVQAVIIWSLIYKKAMQGAIRSCIRKLRQNILKHAWVGEVILYMQQTTKYIGKMEV